MLLSEGQMQELQDWVLGFPLSRPVKSFSRDFSDSTLATEIVYFLFPKLIDLHNYSPATSLSNKKANWVTLNRKVFKKLGFQLTPAEIDKIVTCAPNAVARVLLLLKQASEGVLIEESPLFESEASFSRSRAFRLPLDSRPVELPLSEEQKEERSLREELVELEVKKRKLQQLHRLKDQKIKSLMNQL